MPSEPFLSSATRRPLATTHTDLTPLGLFVGPGDLGLEIAVYSSSGHPRSATLQEAWRTRRGNRATPVLIIALSGDKAWLCGPAGEDVPIVENRDASAIERLCAAALRQPNRHAAQIFLAQALPSLETPAPGVRNEGLFALHELLNDAPNRPDWRDHHARARAAIGSEGRDLLARLGYAVSPLDNLTQLLKRADRRLALAVLIDQTETAEASAARFNNLSPVSYAFTKADNENLDWVILLQGDRLRLYPTKTDIGVGRRGRTETYLELQTSLLSEEQLAYLTLLFSADSLQPGGAVYDLLEKSHRFAASLAENLRERIYTSVVPLLAKGVVAARELRRPTPEDLDLTYRMALTILFRLLFVAYAEDRDLLPYRYSDAYRNRSLKRKAQELAAHTTAGIEPPAGASHWDEVVRIWNAIERGDAEIAVPPYNGGLFTRDPTVSRAGAELAAVRLDNNVFEPALRDLLLTDAGADGPQPIDFRSLGVREFGTIYEGLLESELSVAEQDLTLDRKGSYIPAKRNAPVVVRSGEIYLHNRSGARKSSGSYFTKAFAVEHLLDRALVPALSAHLQRVSRMSEADAAQEFFDFRVADIAMGSGHFLVAAIDRIEKAFTDYLATTGASGAAGVRAELARLKEAARHQLGPLADEVTFEDSQLLRRLIARRCIYGVDITPLAVELARLSIWIHTFVPGLPLSVLDHNLVCGNALVGVGTIEEIKAKFDAAGTSMFPVDADNLLGQAQQPLRRLANLSDATLADVRRAREAMEEARLATLSTKALCDIIAALPLDPEIHFQFERWEERRTKIQADPMRHRAERALEGLRPLHFPVAFPEVFLRGRRGFDVILGNPPWQELTIEDHAFWARHFPGLRGLPQAELEAERERLRRSRPDLVGLLTAEQDAMQRQRRALVSDSYPGMGTGDPDLYKAFLWRFWNLTARSGGCFGVVLPRSALAAKGSETFRKHAFSQAREANLTMLLNRAGWVFDEAEHRYTISLAVLVHGEGHNDSVTLRGPYADHASFISGRSRQVPAFSFPQVLSWNDSASLPLLPTEQSIEVFAQLRKAPRLDLNEGAGWRARPDGELHATNQKDLMTFNAGSPEGFWPVFKGESFDLWTPDNGPSSYYAWADPEVVIPWLYTKRLRSGARRRDSAHSEFPPAYRQDRSTLPCFKPRIAFRDISRATDTRTVRAVLVPPNVFLANQAPYLLWPRGDQLDAAFLVGILSSIPLDWYARRFIETHLNFFLFNPLPVPRPSRTDSRWSRTVELAGRLASPDDRFAEWAAAVGVTHGPLAADEKQDMVSELDAVVAHLYGLNAAQLSHIFETFHEGWDYGSRLETVMRHFETWRQR